MTEVEASGPSSASLYIVFRNGRSSPINIFWVDFKGEEKFWSCIPPMRDLVQLVYTRHIWRIKADDAIFRFIPDERILSGSVLLVHSTGFSILSAYEAEKARIRGIFDASDTDKSGTLDFEEMKRLAPSLGINLPEAELKKMFDSALKSGSSSLTFDDFYHLLSGPPPPSAPTPSTPPPSYDTKSSEMVDPPPPPYEEKEEDLPTSSVKVSDYATRDPLLNDKKELENFLNSRRLPRPDYALIIHGTHTERRGDNTKTITDFRYSINLNAFISGSGKWGENFQSDVEAYHQSTNTLKRITMKKEVKWPGEQALATRIIEHAHKAGYSGSVNVYGAYNGNITQVDTDNSCGVCLRHPCTDCLCCITCLCIFWFPIKYCWQATWTVPCYYTFQDKQAEAYAWECARCYTYEKIKSSWF